ncbi:hypothetical protein [Cellulosimicrobium funkei]
MLTPAEFEAQKARILA